MNKISKLLVVIFLPLIVNAGIGGGGGTTSSSVDSIAGGSGGDVHPSKVQPTDYIRMQTLTNERIIRFQYKPAESNFIQSYSVPVESVSQKYLDALEKSAATNNWESIEVQ